MQPKYLDSEIILNMHVRLRKIWKYLFIVIIFCILLMITYIAISHGPLHFKIKTDDSALYDDFVIMYGASGYRMEGAVTKYKNSLIVDNLNAVTINQKIIALLPSYFFLSICHPLYRCQSKHIQRKNIDEIIDFSEVNMYSWKYQLARDKGEFYKMQTTYISMITDIERNYMPYIKAHNKAIDINKYSTSLFELCMMVYKYKPENDSMNCSLDDFEALLN